MPHKIIDLSVPLEPNAGEPQAVTIKWTRHRKGADQFGRHLIFSPRLSYVQNLRRLLAYLSGKRRLDHTSFPDEEFLSNETVTASVHSGTHMDAPYHYGTRCEGKPASTIDQAPLELFYGDGVVLDFKHLKKGHEIGVQDIENSLDRISCRLKPRDIVLFNTGTSARWGTPAYFTDAPGLGREGLFWLLDQGIRVIGTDCYGLDRPFFIMVEEYFKTRDKRVLWPVHCAGREREYYHMERIGNLDALPAPCGFKVACFPIKITGTGAAWSRCVAIFENGCQ
ncbi:MAG: cyclase family protein [bacterium]